MSCACFGPERAQGKGIAWIPPRRDFDRFGLVASRADVGFLDSARCRTCREAGGLGSATLAFQCRELNSLRLRFLNLAPGRTFQGAARWAAFVRRAPTRIWRRHTVLHRAGNKGRGAGAFAMPRFEFGSLPRPYADVGARSLGKHRFFLFFCKRRFRASGIRSARSLTNLAGYFWIRPDFFDDSCDLALRLAAGDLLVGEFGPRWRRPPTPAGRASSSEVLSSSNLPQPAPPCRLRTWCVDDFLEACSRNITPWQRGPRCPVGFFRWTFVFSPAVWPG